MARKNDRVCISVEDGTKDKLKSMGSKGDTYDDVINGLLGLSSILSNPDLAAALARDCGMSEDFIRELKKFSENLVERGARYRNYDYEAQRLMIRLDLLS